MAFTGNEDHSISLADAKAMTENYRDGAGTGAFLAGFYGKEAVSDILAQEGCVGIRIYNAEKENGDKTFVIVGVDSDGEDLSGGKLAEFGAGCPPICPESSPFAGTE